MTMKMILYYVAIVTDALQCDMLALALKCCAYT